MNRTIFLSQKKYKQLSQISTNITQNDIQKAERMRLASLISDDELKQAVTNICSNNFLDQDVVNVRLCSPRLSLECASHIVEAIVQLDLTYEISWLLVRLTASFQCVSSAQLNILLHKSIDSDATLSKFGEAVYNVLCDDESYIEPLLQLILKLLEQLASVNATCFIDLILILFSYNYLNIDYIIARLSYFTCNSYDLAERYIKLLKDFSNNSFSSHLLSQILFFINNQLQTENSVNSNFITDFNEVLMYCLNCPPFVLIARESQLNEYFEFLIRNNFIITDLIYNALRTLIEIQEKPMNLINQAVLQQMKKQIEQNVYKALKVMHMVLQVCSPAELMRLHYNFDLGCVQKYQIQNEQDFLGMCEILAKYLDISPLLGIVNTLIPILIQRAEEIDIDTDIIELAKQQFYLQ
ncbi:Hypothetical_protein [Hexamita inflata]|uniref:Hypothetical_protein n=1 Tax=Hexamita inflata TaxID=28002 RepID=A0AA86UC82_9EUKA|nr:Hypothetical protein HINF_LOCUS39870 [Hexamita inflata]